MPCELHPMKCASRELCRDAGISIFLKSMGIVHSYSSLRERESCKKAVKSPFSDKLISRMTYVRTGELYSHGFTGTFIR